MTVGELRRLIEPLTDEAQVEIMLRLNPLLTPVIVTPGAWAVVFEDGECRARMDVEL